MQIDDITRLGLCNVVMILHTINNPRCPYFYLHFTIGLHQEIHFHANRSVTLIP